jgi:hypothetical protein
LWKKKIPPKLGQRTEKDFEVNMPVRLIMNNRTLTVLEGTEYDQQLHTFDLRMSKIFQLPNRKD